jgi:hypothetical protein
VAPASSVGAVIVTILLGLRFRSGRGRDVCRHVSIHESDGQHIVLDVSSCLPLQIQEWFGPQLDMILCCVVGGLLPLADHPSEAMQLESVQPFLRFFQRDGGTRASALSEELRERR